MDLDLTYHGREIPEAYEVLFLDALKGDEARSVRSDELDASWKIWTPLLHYLDDESAELRPMEYAYGKQRPAEHISANDSNCPASHSKLLTHIQKRVSMQADEYHTGSHGPEGLEEFLGSYRNQSSQGRKQGSGAEMESFREDVSRTASSSLKTGAQDAPP